MLTHTPREVAVCLASFLWGYKVGDNLAFNFKTLFFLYENREDTVDAKKHLLNKYICITIVSIIEAIFYDFILRLDGATTHFPSSIPTEKKAAIKETLNKDKVKRTRGDTLTGETIEFYRVRNYSLNQMIEIMKKFELLGRADDSLYERLEKAGHLRNRIHIVNWFNNFEVDEEGVFIDLRVTVLEDLLDSVINIMTSTYKRPFDSGQEEFWYKKITI